METPYLKSAVPVLVRAGRNRNSKLYDRACRPTRLSIRFHGLKAERLGFNREKIILRKMGLRVGMSLLIIGVIGGGICLWLPSLTNNRVRLSEAALGLIPVGVLLLLGFVFTILSLIFSIRAGKVAAAYKSQLQPEGIVLFEEDVKGSMTFRNFRSPGRYVNWRKVLITSLIALTNTRLLALKGSSPIIDVPFTDERLRQMKFSLEGEKTLLVAFDANLFQPEWSGEIEYRFKTSQAKRFLELLPR
jgi:hypothetical protein